VACAHHARNRAGLPQRIRSLGKQARDESGKHPVNEDHEENVAGSRVTTGQVDRASACPTPGESARRKKNGRQISGTSISYAVVTRAAGDGLPDALTLILERGLDGQQRFLERREIVLHGIPDNLAVDTLILMAQNVANAGNVFPADILML
jgi:hypothetical protein